MSKLNNKLPGAAVNTRILRDDGKTYAGVCFMPEVYSGTRAVAAIQAAPGMSPGEIARAAAQPMVTSHQPRDPVREGPGWGLYDFPGSRQLYVLRDDNSHLSYGAPQAVFSVGTAQAALSATAGLSATEQARIASAF